MTKDTPANKPVPKTTLREGAIERVTGAIGRKLFEFVIAVSTDDLLLDSTPDEARAVTAQMDDLLLTVHEGESSVEAWAEVLKGRLTDTGQGTAPLAFNLRHLAGGDVTVNLPENDALGALIAQLAARVYPSFLLPPDVTAFPDWTGRPGFNVTSSIFRDPLSNEIDEAMANDEVLKKAFIHSNEHTGSYTMTMASTGRGGSLQRSMLSEHILVGAWNRDATPTLPEFVQQAVERFHMVRDALGGKRLLVAGQISFTGVHLPNSGPFDFGDVRLRAATPMDHEHLPETISGQLSGTDESGVNTLVNYAGDVIAELDFPYEVRISKTGLNDEVFEEFPADLLSLNPIDGVSTRLRMSLLLATQRAQRVQIALSWYRIDDLLSSSVIGWAEPHQFIGLMPTVLTDQETDAWKEWYILLGKPDAKRIQLAISRIVRASGERRDPVDVLIDSVIAWENLFGTSQGEPTLRVTASLAILLEPDPGKRRALRTKLAKIYTLRSDVVHGTRVPGQADFPLCFEALDVAIRAVRMLLKERPDVLAQGDGGGRSLHLILGAPPDESS